MGVASSASKVMRMSDPKTSERMGTVRLPGYEFLAHSAKMWRYPKEDDDGERTGWHFRILTGVPFVVADRDGSYLFSNGFRIDAEDEPIPLPDVDDLTGVEVGSSPRTLPNRESRISPSWRASGATSVALVSGSSNAAEAATGSNSWGSRKDSSRSRPRSATTGGSTWWKARVDSIYADTHGGRFPSRSGHVECL